MGEVKLHLSTDLQDLIGKVDKLDGGIKNLNTSTEQYTQKSKAGFDNSAAAAMRLKDAIKTTEDKIRELQKAEKTYSDYSKNLNAQGVKDWKRVQGEITATENKLQKLTEQQKQSNTHAEHGTSLFKKLAGAIGAAFSVYAIINFSKESVKAYQEQIRSEAKLRTSLKGRESTVKNLISQAKELQGKTLFNDNDIINAEAMLSIYVKDEKQLKALIPLVLDFAQVQQMDLATAANMVSKSVGSGTNALTRYGIEIKGVAGSTERAQMAIDSLSKAFKDQAENALTPEEKQLRAVNLALYEMKKSWGEFVVSLGNQGVFQGVADRLSALRIGFEELGKVKGWDIWEGLSTTLGMLTLMPVLQPDYYLDLEKTWNQIAKDAQIFADALAKAGEAPPPTGYPDPFANVVDDKRRNYEYDTTQYLIKLREGLVDKYGNLLDKENKDLLKQLDDELKWRKERDGQALKSYEDMLKKMRDADKKFAENVKLKPIFDVNNQGEQVREVEVFGEKVKIKFDKVTNSWQIVTDEVKLEQLKQRKDFKEFNEAIQKEVDKANKFAKENPFWAKLGFTDKKQIDQMKDYADEMMSFINEVVDQSVNASERIVDDWNQRIDEQEQLVEREQEDKAEGLANSYALEQENLANMQKARDEAIKDRERNIQIQRSLSMVESGISLVTAAANIIKGFSGIPVIGVVLGLAAVAAMIAGFIVMSAQAKDATKMAEGGQAKHGMLRGRRHSEGGIAIEAEEGEFFTNRQSTQKYLPLLEAINKDDRDGMKLFFDRKFINKMPQQKFSFDIDKSKKLGEIVRELKKGKAEITYGANYIIERIGGYTKKINLS